MAEQLLNQQENATIFHMEKKVSQNSLWKFNTKSKKQASWNFAGGGVRKTFMSAGGKWRNFKG